MGNIEIWFCACLGHGELLLAVESQIWLCWSDLEIAGEVSLAGTAKAGQ